MAVNFPAKIYQILENESPEIIRWHSNGCAFRIVDHGRFEREIIPKYFRHNQLSSVQRQLNLYGFKCVSRGEDKGAFFHPLFKRGDWEVVKKITRFVPGKKGSDDAASPNNNNSSNNNNNSAAAAPKSEREGERERLRGGERHPFNNNALHARSPAVAHAVASAHTVVLPNTAVPQFRSPFDPYGFFESHALAPTVLPGVHPAVLPAVHHSVHPNVCAVPSWTDTHSAQALSLCEAALSLTPQSTALTASVNGEAEEDVVRAYPRSEPVSSERKQRAIEKARTRQRTAIDSAANTDGTTDNSSAATAESTPCGEEKEKERVAQRQRNAARPFVFVVQDAVTIDPDFDLDDDLLLFDSDAHHLALPPNPFHATFSHDAHTEKCNTRDVGVNTESDLSVVCPHCRK